MFIKDIRASIMEKTGRFQFVFQMLSLVALSSIAHAQGLAVKSYGNFTHMVTSGDSDGVVLLKDAIPVPHGYAIGALANGRGEIVVINNQVWLDYGEDGLGKTVGEVPEDEQAVILVAAQVAAWSSSILDKSLPKQALYNAILEAAKQLGVDISKPFPFMLEGSFSHLGLHVINEKNPQHGKAKGAHFYRLIKEKRKQQTATILGFYSADQQGIYTHIGQSWHLHAVIEDENIAAHVDEISANEGIVLKLPEI